jgi:hypothetical protein
MIVIVKLAKAAASTSTSRRLSSTKPRAARPATGSATPTRQTGEFCDATFEENCGAIDNLAWGYGYGGGGCRQYRPITTDTATISANAGSLLAPDAMRYQPPSSATFFTTLIRNPSWSTSSVDISSGATLVITTMPRPPVLLPNAIVR